MFVDTHCHLNMMAQRSFGNVDKKRVNSLSREECAYIDVVVENAFKNKVTKIINIGTNVNDSIHSIAIAQRYESVYTTVGIHPCDASVDWKKNVDEIKKLALKKEEYKVVGIGEVGLDFFHKPYNKQWQADLFKAHIELSLQHDLSLVVHVRDAIEESLKIIEGYAKDIKRGAFHCFCHDASVAKLVVEWGFHIGIGGPVTYPKNNYLRTIIKNVPLENIVLETDAPFLPPQDYRGKLNTPAYIPIIAQTIADERDISLEEVGKVTTKNAYRLFSL
jgi:TatD DNase family protein